MPDQYGPTTIAASTPDNLLTNLHPPVELAITVASGQGELKRGQLLGFVTATEKFAVYDPDASDGTETAVAILTDEIDATSEDVICRAFYHGVFRREGCYGLDDAAEADLISRIWFV